MSSAQTPNTSQEEKNENHRSPPHQWTVDFLYKEFDKESDRAAVILVASLIDECLAALLKMYLVPIAQSKDSLFDSATAPLSTFSAKIDLSHRVGLLSANLCRDIHLIRKIRNSFAHDIYGCTFQNGSVRSRVDELFKSVVVLKQYGGLATRDKFLRIGGGILLYLNASTKDIDTLEHPAKEWLYETP